MNFTNHQQTCIAFAVKIARLRGFAVEETEPKYVKLGLTWSGELQQIPIAQLGPALAEAWRWHNHAEPFAAESVLTAWRGLQTRPTPDSVQQIARMANCAHEYQWFPEETPLFTGLWECYKCGHARPALREGAAAGYLRQAGIGGVA